MRYVIGFALIGGIALGALSASAGVTYTVNNEKCSKNQQCSGTCSTSTMSVATTICSSGVQCCGFKCAGGPAYTACTYNALQGGGCIMTGMDIAGCFGGANYYSATPQNSSCAVNGVC